MREWSMQQLKERRAREAMEADDMAAYWEYLQKVCSYTLDLGTLLSA